MELLDSHYFNDDRFVYSYFKTQSRQKDGWINNFSNKCFFVLYFIGKVQGGTAPILTGYKDSLYSNPLPHVLILTAIVVGVATNALGLALVVRIHEAFDSIEEKKLLALKIEDGHQENEQKDNKL